MPNFGGTLLALRSRDGRREDDISISDASMIPLKIDRPGKFFVAVESAAGDSRYFLFGDNSLAVLDNCHISADERNIERLPLVWPSRLRRIRRKKTIDCPHPMTWGFIKGIVFHLHFVATAEINAAVGIARAVHLHMQFEIRELLLCGDV